MSVLEFRPSVLQGQISAPPSKSYAHRLLIAAALSDSPCLVRRAGRSDDVLATASCLCALGAKIRFDGEDVSVEPIRSVPSSVSLDCRDSASTLRFLLPVASALCSQVRITGSETLLRRPVTDLLFAMNAHGVQPCKDHMPVSLSGLLNSGEYRLPGNVSSQYVTGLLFALPLLNGKSRIVLTTPLSSSGYVDMTLHVLEQSGISVIREASGFLIPGGQKYHAPVELTVEGDWSGAAYFLAAGALGGPVSVRGLVPDSEQADRRIADLLSRFGADVVQYGSVCTVTGRPLHAITADLDDCPDLAPPLAALAACADGTSVFTGCGRLHFKESDRLDTICTTLQAFGIHAAAQGNVLTVTGGTLRPALCESFHDHRIAMLAAILAAKTDNASTLSDPFCVQKSYPEFYNDYLSLGGIIHGFQFR